VLKRAFDIVVAACAVTVAAPLLAAVAAAIKVSSPGPIFYRGVRVGRGGKLFRIFKYRTMVVDAEKIGGPSTADDDRRITPIGKILREYKLDELPQLLNVLAGDMSLVGPRPEVPQYVDMYSEKEKAILTVRPGITDFASLWNSDEGALLAGSADPEKTYLEQVRPEKIRLQLEYIRSQSLLVDLKILTQTAGIVIGRPFHKRNGLQANPHRKL